MNWVRIGRPEDLAFAPGAAVNVGKRRLAVFPLEDGYAAIANACPHANAPLCDGTLLSGKVVCSLHLWEFDLRTGACDVGRDWAVETYPVRLVDGELEVQVPGD